MLSFLLSGWFLLRYDARRFIELLFHEPPRRLDRTPVSMITDLAPEEPGIATSRDAANRSVHATVVRRNRCVTAGGENIPGDGLAVLR